jgi:hypothetical protein
MTSPWPCAAVPKDIATALGADIDAANCKYYSSTFGRTQTRLEPRRSCYDSGNDTDSLQHHGHLSLPRQRRANLNMFQQLNHRLASEAVRANSALIIDIIDVYEMPDAPDQRRVGVK